MATLVYALIAGFSLLIYGLYSLIFKDIVTNKDIIIILLLGFAYCGYMFQMLNDKR